MANGIINNGLYSVQGAYKAAVAVGRGTFVKLDYANKTFILPGTDGLGDLYFVMNAVTTPPELGQADKDFKVAIGVEGELAKLQVGATFTTTVINGAIGTYAVGDVVAVSASGEVKKGIATPVMKAVVKEVIANYGGEAAVKCIVTAI